LNIKSHVSFLYLTSDETYPAPNFLRDERKARPLHIKIKNVLTIIRSKIYSAISAFYLLLIMGDVQLDTVQLNTSHSQRLNSGKSSGIVSGCRQLHRV